MGYSLGWSYLYSPEATLDTAKVITVGLNPGGGHAGDEQWSQEGGNAYACQNWGRDGTPTAIQQQMRRWFGLLPYRLDEIVWLQYVPFRSPNWAALADKAEALTAGDALWRWVLPHLSRYRVFGRGHDHELAGALFAA